MARLAIAGFEANGWRVVAAKGVIDAGNVAEFETHLLAARGGRLVVDLSEVTFFDLAGFASLLTARTEARSLGVQLRLVVGERAVHLLDALKSCASWLIYRTTASATDTEDADVAAAMRRLLLDELTAQR